MEKEVGDMIEKLRFMQEELGLDIPEGVTVEEDEKGFQALQTKILKQISEVKDVYRFSIIVNILVNWEAQWAFWTRCKSKKGYWSECICL